MSSLPKTATTGVTPLPRCRALDGRGKQVAGPAERTIAVRSVMSADTLTKLKAVAATTATTGAEGLIACYGAFLHRLLGESDVVIAMPLMARVGRTALRTPAMAVNVLPLRLTVRSGDRLGDLSKQVAASMKSMRAHQRYRGENLARDLAVAGSGALLHGIGINLKAFDFALDFAGAVGVLRNVAGGPPEDLGLTVTPIADGEVLLGFEVDARTNTRESVERRLAGFVSIIDAMVGEDDPAVGQVDVLSVAEADRILVDRESAPSAGRIEHVADVFDRVVAQQLEATVLVCGDESLTGGELGARVYRLARALRARSVGPDDIVGIALPRTAGHGCCTARDAPSRGRLRRTGSRASGRAPAGSDRRCSAKGRAHHRCTGGATFGGFPAGSSGSGVRDAARGTHALLRSAYRRE